VKIEEYGSTILIHDCQRSGFFATHCRPSGLTLPLRQWITLFVYS